MTNPLEVPAVWQVRDDPAGDREPWEAEVGGQRWRVRLNDFPEEPLYTVIVDGREVASFNDWPACWTRPEGAPGAAPRRVRAEPGGEGDPYQRREFEREAEKFIADPGGPPGGPSASGPPEAVH